MGQESIAFGGAAWRKSPFGRPLAPPRWVGTLTSLPGFGFSFPGGFALAYRFLD